MIGGRCFGLPARARCPSRHDRGAAVGVLLPAALYGSVADTAAAQGALRGMGAVAAGLITATGIKLIAALDKNPMGMRVCSALAALTFVAIGLLRWPLLWVLLGLGGGACLWAYYVLKVARTRGQRMSMLSTPANWLDLFTHFASLSLLAVGGAITTAPDMHRYLVLENSWISDGQFTSSIALSQAAPGPNVLFVALLGWNVGLNAGGGLAAGPWAWMLALLGVLVTMVAIMLPSSVLTYTATRWAHRTARCARCGP